MHSAEAADDATTDPEFWRARAEELETALQARIVLEQAKGVLAERFGCDPVSAFEILRRNARCNRRRIHELAAEIVASTRTVSSDAGPPPLVSHAGGKSDG